MRYLRNHSGLNKKKRRHSGWVTPRSTIKMNRQWLIDNCLEPTIFYDDWEDYRDGLRSHGDRKRIRNCPLCDCYSGCNDFNHKHKRLIERRKARKYGRVA